MNKKGKTTIVLSAILTLVILVSSIYIMIPDKVKLVVEETNTKMYVWENEKWTLGATEYVNIFDGSTKMRANSRDVTYDISNNITTITRTSNWKDNIITIDTYKFDSTVDDVTMFPISHDVNILNAKDKILHFEYRDLLYDGETRPASSPEKFGHKMFVEWTEPDNFMWAKVYQQSVASDKLIIRYRVTSEDETYSVRLFDPPTGGASYYNYEEGTGTSVNDSWNSNDCQATGVLTWSTNVPYFKVVNHGGTYSGYFNGNYPSGTPTYLISDSNVDFGSDDFSISFWYNGTSYNDISAVILETYGDLGSSHFIRIQIDNVDGKEKIQALLSVTGANGYSKTNSTTALDGDWQNVIVVRDNTEEKLIIYINGVDDTIEVTPLNASYSLTASPLRVGSRYGNLRPYKGYIDEIKIYNYSLSPTEAMNVANYGYVNSSIPVTQSSSIETDTSSICYNDLIDNNSSLEGWCNVTDADGEDLIYNYKWYKNGVNVAEFIAANESECYQEHANVSTSCGGLSTGNYSWTGTVTTESNSYDGDYDTYSSFNYLENVTYNVLYEIPTTTSSAKLQRKTSSHIGTSSVNTTIPTQCLSDNFLDIKFENTGGGTRSFFLYCYNGSDYVYLANSASATSGNINFYEEGVYWTYTIEEHAEGVDFNAYNISSDDISVGDNWTFSCRGCDTGNCSEWLNSTTKVIYNLSFIIDDVDVSTLSSPIRKELGSVILNATINTGTVYIDHSAVDFGTNYSSGSPSTQFNAEISDFHKRTTADGDSNITLYYNGPENQSFNVLGHQYDEFNNLSFNLTGALYNGTFPSGVSIYVNGDLSNIIGMLSNTTSFSENEFNDKTTSFNSSLIEQTITLVNNISLPKTANVTSATMDLSGYEDIGGYTGVSLDISHPDGLYAVPEGIDTNGTHFWISYDTIFNNNHIQKLALYYVNGTFINFIINDSYSILGRYAYGVCTDGTNIWQGSVNNYICVKFDMDGNYVSNFSIGTQNTYGIDKSGTNLYIVSSKDNGDHLIRKYTDAGSHVTDYDVSSQTIYPRGLTTDGTNIWITERFNHYVRKYLLDGTYVGVDWNTIEDNGYSFDITQDGTYFYTLDYDDKRIYKYSFASYPSNAYMEVGTIDGDKEWEFSGELNESNSPNMSNDFAAKINLYLDSCTADSHGFCNIPIYLFSNTSGIIELSNLEVNYTYNPNPVYLDVDLVQDVLDAGSGYTNITITIYDEDNGSIFVDAIDYDYLGGVSPTYTIKAHSADDYCYIENTLTYSYSGWDYSLPDNIDYVDWYPPSPTAQDVMPFGQTVTIPIFNVTTENYGANMDFYIKQYDDETSCVNLTVGDSSNKSAGTSMVNNTYIKLESNLTSDSNFGIWLWADLDCSYTDWRVWQPTIQMKGEATT